MTPYDAIVLAGGRSVRLGTDKTRVAVGGTPVLDRVLAAVADARSRLVVGPSRPLADASRVRWLREDPPGSGPASGVACAVPYVASELVAVLAGDLPYVEPATVSRLVEATGDGDGAVLHDADARPQWLCAVVRTTALRRQVASRDDWAGAAMRELLDPLDLANVVSVGAESHDIDTPDDIPSEP
ncbi:molybdenum cofactor guanylyltransferase [Solicola gregarius]|uniref:Molybdenum cofactor guanylyltransferase n=1 Tax=Solicola gregarius TaxID=2908642 RepID=A0AA46TLR5_9ACTN|nr:molybdenum cofactor guanylyltransferase [Solicola gregarius]UYM07611.1 molybdenum cofactor guanylyltransferase [Solicola gregarius]